MAVVETSDPFIPVVLNPVGRNGEDIGLPKVEMKLTQAQKRQFDRYWNDASYRRNHYAPNFFRDAILRAGYIINEGGDGIFFDKSRNNLTKGN